MAKTKGRQPLAIVNERLQQAYPDAKYELDWETPLQLLVATILAAQCTDERVNAVTKTLFPKYPSAAAFADADTAELEEDLKPTGFYRNKTKAVQGCCRVLVDNFNGEVPRTMDEMLTLPGVARKTANVVLTNAFGLPTGVIVDTHVARVTQRLGVVQSKKPEQIEVELMEQLPEKDWIPFGPAMVLHGRYICTHDAPNCPDCILNDICPVAAGRKLKTPDAATWRLKRPGQTEDETAPAPAAKAKKAAPAAVDVPDLPDDWLEALRPEFSKPYWRELQEFVRGERAAHTVFPPAEDVFNALKLTPFSDVKVLLLGQDPYHDDGQAHGLCFSVRPGVKPPPSLVNIFKELRDDLGCKVPNHGYLAQWASEGILLLNAVLTVRAHTPNSHKDRGWETFTDAIIAALNDRDEPVVFVLWGAYAQKKEKLIDADKHRVLKAAHPSPLSAKKFFGSRPFSAIDAALEELGESPISWQIDDR